MPRSDSSVSFVVGNDRPTSVGALLVGEGKGEKLTQQLRRHDPYPWTWEIPVGAAMAILLLLTGGVHLGRALANLFAGAGWHLPTRVDLFSSLPGVLGGHAGAGLQVLPAHVASPSALWLWIAVTELLLLVACLVVLKLGLDQWGPARMKGMASRAEAEQLLGLTRLRKHSAVVRPDLYGKDRRRT